MPKETEFSKLYSMLEIYEKILHPDFFNAFKKQLNAAYEENKKNALIEAKISDDALWIENEVNYLHQNFKKEIEHPELSTFYLRCFYKKLLKRFLK